MGFRFLIFGIRSLILIFSNSASPKITTILRSQFIKELLFSILINSLNILNSENLLSKLSSILK